MQYRRDKRLVFSPDLELFNLRLLHDRNAMPPKNGNGAVPSNSRDLVPTGPKEVQVKHRPKGKSNRNEDGILLTTARALVLRNGKHGAMGAGELVSTRHIMGREKLDLLGGELITSYSRLCSSVGRGPRDTIRKGREYTHASV